MAAKGKLTFDRDKCKGCSLCIEACPVNILGLENDVNKKGYQPAYIIEPDKCIACQNCAIMCPDYVIEIEKVN